MNELPDLPFEQILSYLSLKDRLKARTVSRAWRNKFDRYPVTTLCYSSGPSGFISGKSRWVSGAFAENIISSTRFTSFFDTFGQTILSTLKHLRLCDPHLRVGDQEAFARILNSFGQLEQLDIFWIEFDQQDMLNLNLPMLTSLQLEDVNGIEKLTLEAPRLQQVKILDDYGTNLRVEIVHGESVEKLLIERSEHTDVKKLKNLKALYIGDRPFERIDSTFLSSLQQLKEIHVENDQRVSELFEQKQRLGRADLKIYLCGLLLNGPDDPARNGLKYTFGHLNRESLVCLAKNPSRLADKIPFYRYLNYSDIEQVVSPSLEVDLLKRYIHLKKIKVNRPVQNIERFLCLLKNCENIVEWEFRGDQPQDLFDRLPEHCAVQKLVMFIDRPPSDLAFLFRLKHLILLSVGCPIDSEIIRRAFEELPLLSFFFFKYDNKMVSIEIGNAKQFIAWILGKGQTIASDLNAAIEFIFENSN